MTRILQYFAASLLIACLFSCSDKSNEGGESHTITIATSADNPPYEFIKDGKIIGLDIDIINEIGRILDKKIIIKNLDFPGLFPALSSKNVDLVIAAISVTEERKKHFDFSDVYASSSMAILYRKQDDIKTIEDLKGQIIGAQLGSTWNQAAKELATKMPTTIVRSLANNLVLIEELKSGSVDAVVLEEMQVEKFINNNPELASLKLPGLYSEFAIAVPKDSPLLREINEAIEKLKTTDELSSIMKRWIQ